MSLEWRNRARERRLARRNARKLFKSGVKQPPQVYAAYLEGLVRGAQVREAQELRVEDYPTFDYFGNRVSGKDVQAPSVHADFADDECDFAPAPHFVLH